MDVSSSNTKSCYLKCDNQTIARPEVLTDGPEHFGGHCCIPAPALTRGTACALWWLIPMCDHRVPTEQLEIHGVQGNYLHPS